MSDYIYCRWHPGQVVSNGMFDAPCGACENEMDQAAYEWEVSPDNPTRKLCGMEMWILPEPQRYGVARTCNDPCPDEDQIPF